MAITIAALPIVILEMIPSIVRISPVSNWPSHKTRQAGEKKKEHAGSDLFDEDKHCSYLDKIDISFDQTCWWILCSMKECSPMAERRRIPSLDYFFIFSPTKSSRSGLSNVTDQFSTFVFVTGIITRIKTRAFLSFIERLSTTSRTIAIFVGLSFLSIDQTIEIKIRYWWWTSSSQTTIDCLETEQRRIMILICQIVCQAWNHLFSFSSVHVRSPRLSLFDGLKNLREKNRTYFIAEVSFESFDLVFLSSLIVSVREKLE